MDDTTWLKGKSLWETVVTELQLSRVIAQKKKRERDDQLPIVKQLVISIERKPQFWLVWWLLLLVVASARWGCHTTAQPVLNSLCLNSLVFLLCQSLCIVSKESSKHTQRSTQSLNIKTLRLDSSWSHFFPRVVVVVPLPTTTTTTATRKKFSVCARILFFPRETHYWSKAIRCRP